MCSYLIDVSIVNPHPSSFRYLEVNTIVMSFETMEKVHGNLETVPMLSDVSDYGQDIAAHSTESLLLINEPKPSHLPPAAPGILNACLQALPIFKCIVLFLVPSFLVPASCDAAAKPQRPKGAALHWLDGLRGWASFSVMIHHVSAMFIDDVWGYAQKKNAYQWYRLPFVRLFSAGPAAVSLFFIISGFALSIKPLKQMRSGAFADLCVTLASGTFRRPWRLYFPLFVSGLMIVLAGQTGVYGRMLPYMEGLIRWDEWHYHPQRADFFSEIGLWLRNIYDFCFGRMYFWSSQPYMYAYDPHMWTVPVEFRCSLILFLTQLAVSRLRTAVRLFILFALIICSPAQKWWDMELFWGGMLLCEIHLILAMRARVQEVVLPVDSEPKLGRISPCWYSSSWGSFAWLRTPVTVTVFQVLNATCALYLLSTPERGCEQTPGYRLLCSSIPKSWGAASIFWFGSGALQLLTGVVLAANYPSLLGSFSLSELLSSRLSRYLGDISFALYCVHGLISHTLGPLIFHPILTATGSQNSLLWGCGVVLYLVLIIIPIVWAADVFWRAVDKPSVTLTRMLEEVCLPRKN